MIISLGKRENVVIFVSSILLLLLQLLGETSGLVLQKIPTFGTVSVTRQRQSTRLWSSVSSATGVDETTSLDDQITQPPTYDWDEQFEELQSFLSEYGHCNFPKNPPEELKKKYPRLHPRFCDDQRVEYKRLRSCRVRGVARSLQLFDLECRCRRLDELGFEFHRSSAQWYDRYHELIHYSNENGHVRVTKDNDATLNGWVRTQRCKRTGTKTPKLDDFQIKLLDDIGFEWESEFYDDRWNIKYKELLSFRNTHGHFMVDLDGPLNRWMKHQRSRRAQKRGQAALTDEQIRLLDKIEFPWEPERLDSKWSALYDELQAFHKKHGHCNPNVSKHPALYHWVSYQRLYKQSLSTEQTKLLEKINFRWERNSKQWPKMYNELLEYHSTYGHLQVNQEDDPDLYEWMSVQRNRYHSTSTVKREMMPEEQIEKLEEIHFCWSLDWRERTWHEKFTEAVEFSKEHGHVLVKEKESPSLYNWIQIQEKRYKEAEGQKPLSGEELEMLEQLDFPFLEGQPRMAWSAMYSEIERYRVENDGRFPISHKDDSDLSRWMRQQQRRLRCEFGYSPLSDEQKCLLESIDFPIYPNGKQRRTWYEKYDELVEFQKEHGHFVVVESENQMLYDWTKNQRQRRNGRKRKGYTQLSKSRIYLLERIGFPWTSDRDDVEWRETYEELVQFQREHGHLRAKESEHPRLYHWIGRQKKRYRGVGGTSKDLSEYQISRLEKIGLVGLWLV